MAKRVSGFLLCFVFAVGLLIVPASRLHAENLKIVEANGIIFSYIEEGTGPLVLLFHGYPESARSWQGVQGRLAAEGYRVVAPFMRGYPPTGFAEDGDYSARALGADAIALTEALGYYWSLFDEGLNKGQASTAESVIAVPTLVIAGTADGAFGIERYPTAEPAFVGGYEFAALENIGHFPQLEASQKVADLILDFLKD